MLIRTAKPDPTIHKYLSRIASQFRDDHPDDWLCVYAFIPDGPEGSERKRWYHPNTPLADIVEWCKEKNAEGRNIYAPWAAFSTKSRSKTTMTVSAAFVADWDGGKPDMTLGKPMFTVQTSPGRWQHIYVSKTLLDRATAKVTYQSLKERLGCDDCSSNPHALWRVPGTTNYPDAKKRAAGRVPVLSTLSTEVNGKVALPLVTASDIIVDEFDIEVIPYTPELEASLADLPNRYHRRAADDPTGLKKPYKEDGTPDGSVWGMSIATMLLGGDYTPPEMRAIMLGGGGGEIVQEWASRKPNALDRTINKAIAEAGGGINVKKPNPTAQFEVLGPEVPWPAPMREEAFYGIAGEFVRLVLPETEACPEALLVNFLTMFGNAIGRGPHCFADGAEHHANIYVGTVGETSEGAKGTATHRAIPVFLGVEEHPTAENPPEGPGYGPWKDVICSALSTGEGLIKRLLAEDKRCMAIIKEFAATIIVMSRPGNTLSPVIRGFWDDGRGETTTKTDPMRTEDAFLSIIGHITPDELRNTLTASSYANGFANRILWCCTKRSKPLPDGGKFVELSPLTRRIEGMMRMARTRKVLKRDEAASKLWHDVYPTLIAKRPGLAGEVVARGAPQVLRLSLIYALLDGADCIGVPHLRAALAVWDYCEASAKHIFGDATGNPVAERIRSELRLHGAMTRTEINRSFAGNKSRAEIDLAINALAQSNAIQRVPADKKAGRPVETWELIP